MIKTRKVSQSKIRTRKNIGKNYHSYSHDKITSMFLQMLNTVKLYHWKTFSYPQHVATDSLYGSLNEKIDEFIEVMLGKTGTRINLINQKSIPLMDFTNVNDFKREIANYKRFLINMDKSNLSDNTDLLNIRDEILGLLNKFTYLLTFK